MKTKQQIKNEEKCRVCGGEVYTLAEFLRLVRDGYITDYDGLGYFHDGHNETDHSVWDTYSISDIARYPYVCWYNK